MATPDQIAALQAAVDAAAAAVVQQGDAVRALKAKAKDGSADKSAVDAEIARLKDLKLAAEAAQASYEAVAGRTSSSSAEAFRAAVANALERRLFYLPSFKIYGAVAGFYDYGPPGCAVKANITAAWRAHFVLEEGMLEVECPAVTPEAVLKASGHVDRFTDLMVSDTLTGDCHRADHLLEEALEKALADTANPLTPHQREEARTLLATVEELTADGLGEALARYSVSAPDTGNPLSKPYAFNLMFRTSIGPRGDAVGYLRPETAQGIFVNFKDLLYYNGGRLPFAAAQIGQSYRNEINPRAGLLRVREFTQAEIEHFCNPDDKAHPKFAGAVAGLAPLLFSRALQMGEAKVAEPMQLGEAVAKGIIANETLAYFIGRTWQFFTKVGIDPARLRFRQHLVHEMAHYAEDCWDAEVQTSYGWIECAGLADRSAYDLNAHAAATKADLTVFEKFEETKVVEALEAIPDKKALGMAFKKEAKAVTDALAALQPAGAEAFRDALAATGSAPLTLACGTVVTLTPEQVKMEVVTKKLTGRSYTPSVIEPSFGIGRIIYCMFEHCYYTRESGDDKRSVFRFAPAIAPVKATVFPLLARPEMRASAQALAAAITAAGVSNLVDTTATTIGRRYARTDEIGVPFGVTVDGQTAADGTATLRERDSMAQVRVPASDLPSLLRSLVGGKTTWADVAARFPPQEPPKEEEEGK